LNCGYIERVGIRGQRRVEFRRGKDGEKHQRFRVRIERAMHDPRRDVRDFAGVEDAELITDPLLGPAVDHVNDLLAMRMVVKRVTMHRVHVRAHEQKLFSGHEIGPAEPFVVGPRVCFTNGFRDLNEAAFRSVHEDGG